MNRDRCSAVLLAQCTQYKMGKEGKREGRNMQHGAMSYTGSNAAHVDFAHV